MPDIFDQISTKQKTQAKQDVWSQAMPENYGDVTQLSPEQRRQGAASMVELGSLAAALPAASVGIGALTLGGGKALAEKIKGKSTKEAAIQGVEIGGGAYLGGKIIETAFGAIPYGRAVINRLAQAKSSKETGDVIAAIQSVSPKAITKEGLLQQLKKSRMTLSKSLGSELNSATTPANIDTAIGGARLRAQAANSGVKGVLGRFDKEINAAKNIAGITGTDATPRQLFDFQQAIEGAYRRPPTGPISALSNDILKDAYAGTGQALRTVTNPKVGDLLQQITNIHAAESSVTRYPFSRATASAITAGANPNLARVVTPAVGYVGYKTGERVIGGAQRGLFPSSTDIRP